MGWDKVGSVLDDGPNSEDWMKRLREHDLEGDIIGEGTLGQETGVGVAWAI